MKVFTAALPFLILAAALGPQTHGLPARELGLAIREPHRPMIQHAGVHRPSTCCFSFTPRSIRCEIMKDYFLTTSGCSQPAVIFRTKGEQEVCFRPSADGVRECMVKLDSAETPGKESGEEKLY
ncbi:C-C motif chemokine 15-like [Sturnira hondurensis]|uniref:C-C motif chemokine 15-like n=1 Tax=Sturnira hondurensis TaxID=192404 RepID=UPI00187A5A9E|nr:C-C motif chemokine 15-like [Sturnira hondurensis]